MIGPHLAELFLYIPKPLKKRLVAVCEQREGLSLSKVGRACIEACIDGLIQALNVHQKELFATAAKLLQQDAEKLTGDAEKEIAELTNMLQQAKLQPLAT